MIQQVQWSVTLIINMNTQIMHEHFNTSWYKIMSCITKLILIWISGSQNTSITCNRAMTQKTK